MVKSLLYILGGFIISLALIGVTLVQNTQTANITTAQPVSDTQDSDGTGAVIGHPADNEGQSGSQAGAPSSKRMSTVAAPDTPSAYNVPLLNIATFRKNTHIPLEVTLLREFSNVRADLFIKARKDGIKQIRMSFQEILRAPANTRLVLWAVSPEKRYTRIGQVTNMDRGNEARIDAATELKDFGLFLTVEGTDRPQQPAGPLVSKITRDPYRVFRSNANQPQ